MADFFVYGNNSFVYLNLSMGILSHSGRGMF
ncbi:hypothetical protein EV198_2860 [Roseivirga ehrenbergii]|nr:hypothetical protein EV198_2860 [Roseivirga ehrenbergii]